jgi:hypothetical protein
MFASIVIFEAVYDNFFSTDIEQRHNMRTARGGKQHGQRIFVYFGQMNLQ